MKITVKKSEKKEYSEVILREPTGNDLLEAHRIAGSDEGMPLVAAMLSQIATFDGQRLTYEDIKMLPLTLFLELATELTASGLMGSEEPSFISQLKEASTPLQS